MSATVATAEGVVVRAFDGPSGPTGWQFSWDGRDENGALVAAGPYTVTVSGTDLGSGAVDSETFTIDLETTPPASITSPAAGPVLEDRKSTRLHSSPQCASRMPSSD